MHGAWRYGKDRGWLVRKLGEADADAWNEHGWNPTRWQLFAARLLLRIEHYRAAWLSLFPPPVPAMCAAAELDSDERWYARGFYRCKASLCLVLGFGPHPTNWQPSVEVAWFDYDHGDWSQVNVGDGVFTQWWAELVEESGGG